MYAEDFQPKEHPQPYSNAHDVFPFYCNSIRNR